MTTDTIVDEPGQNQGASSVMESVADPRHGVDAAVARLRAATGFRLPTNLAPTADSLIQATSQETTVAEIIASATEAPAKVEARTPSLKLSPYRLRRLSGKVPLQDAERYEVIDKLRRDAETTAQVTELARGMGLIYSPIKPLGGEATPVAPVTPVPNLSPSEKPAAATKRGFAMVPYDVMDGPDYQGLSCPAKAALLEVTRRHNGRNNGKISFSGEEMARRLGIGRRQGKEAMRELVTAGLIKLVTPSRGNPASKGRLAPEYKISWAKNAGERDT